MRPNPALGDLGLGSHHKYGKERTIMTRIGLGVVLGALALAAAKDVPTVTKNMMGREFTHRFTDGTKEVGGEPGHIVGPWADRGVCLDNVGQMDEEAGVLTSSATLDAVFASRGHTRSCTMKGKSTCTLRDGSVRTHEWTADCKGEPDGSLSWEGRGVFVSGTGRFEGIQGSVSFKTWELIPGPGPQVIAFSKVTAEITLPKK
jgi:hypothetical protein